MRKLTITRIGSQKGLNIEANADGEWISSDFEIGTVSPDVLTELMISRTMVEVDVVIGVLPTTRLWATVTSFDAMCEDTQWYSLRILTDLEAAKQRLIREPATSIAFLTRNPDLLKVLDIQCQSVPLHSVNCKPSDDAFCSACKLAMLKELEAGR